MPSTNVSRYIVADDHEIALDPEGHLVDLDDWTPVIAEILAREEGITLTEPHWEVIEVLRTFYVRYQMAPAMRPLVKAVALSLGADKGRSLYLMRLFPGSPARVGARLAGLPKPANCL